MANEKRKILNTRIINKHAALTDWLAIDKAGTGKGAGILSSKKG